MNWYNFLKYAASPKNIINNWKVDDPFLKFFIYTYEPTIDLNVVKSKEQLVDFIKTSLIPDLKKKIDRKNPDSYYKKTMTDEEALAELNEHPNDPRLQAAKKVFLANPTESKKVLLNAINEDKQLSFDKWWEYMQQDYSDNPAFFYSMLNPMFDKSPAAQKNPVPPAHREAVEIIADEIGTKGVNQMNISKKFTKTSFNLDKDTSKSIDIDDKKGWIRIDSKLRDRGEYKSNQEKLMRFSTDSGWCVAQYRLCHTYLSEGDFWLYFENKKPKVAIRLRGDKKVEEIRGLYNKQDTLDPLWEPVTTFLHNTDFDYQNNSFYKRLQDIMYKNVDLENNPEAYQSLLKAIKSDPKQLGIVSDENKAKFPELVKAAAFGYEKRLNDLLDHIEQIPTTGGEYQKRFSKFQDELGDIPEEVKPYMSDNVSNRLATVHRNAFLRNPLEYEFFPDDMKAVITPQDKKKAWTDYVGQDPYRYNDMRIPAEIRKYIPLKPILEGWERLVNLNVNHAYNMPSFILNVKNARGDRFFPENYIENKIIEDFKKYPVNRTNEGYDKLQKIQEKRLLTEEQIAQVYVDFVSKNVNNKKMQNPITLVPPQYREMIMQNIDSSQQGGGNISGASPILDRYYSKIIADASYFESIPDEGIRNALLTKPEYLDGVRKSFERMQQGYGTDWNGFWSDIPNDIKQIMSDQIKNSVANFWLPYVQKNRSLLGNLDNIIRPLVENKLQSLINESSVKNWYKRSRI